MKYNRVVGSNRDVVKRIIGNAGAQIIGVNIFHDIGCSRSRLRSDVLEMVALFDRRSCVRAVVAKRAAHAKPVSDVAEGITKKGDPLK